VDQGEKRERICIVIPMCNEESSIPNLRKELNILHSILVRRYFMEYCFVNDGSTDGTGNLIETLCPEGAACHVITHKCNYGIGASFRNAFSRIEADIVCTIDADCSYAPENLELLIDKIHRHNADVVVASPYHPEGHVDGVQRWRLLLSLQCSRFYRLITPLKLHTYTSVFRAYRGSVTKEIQFPGNGFVAAVEILLSASSLGYRIEEVPLTLSRRAHGQSKMRIVRTVTGHMQLLMQCAIARLRGQYLKPSVAAPSVQDVTLQFTAKMYANRVGANSMQEKSLPMVARFYSATEKSAFGE
jgi:dolichol-phosphate mannosyltransferase